jgi:hypothetical protein
MRTLELTTLAGVGACGQTSRSSSPAGPLWKALDCGRLQFGNGTSTIPPLPEPDGATVRATLACTGSHCTIGPAATSGPTYGCTATGCTFGFPVPVPLAGLTSCLTRVFTSSVGGTLDLADGTGSATVALRGRVILTGNPTQPCAICRQGSLAGPPCAGSPGTPCAGVCDGGANQGSACTSTDSQGLTSDCSMPVASSGQSECFRGTNAGNPCATSADCPSGSCASLVGDVPVALNLATGTSTLSSTSGIFCPGQTTTGAGCFLTNVCRAGTAAGQPCATTAECPGGACVAKACDGGVNDGKGCGAAADCPGAACVTAGSLCRSMRVTGSPAGAVTIGVPATFTLASTFCVPASSALLNASVGLPGPGAASVTFRGTVLP